MKALVFQLVEITYLSRHWFQICNLQPLHRGAMATSNDRAEVEEAQVSLEAFGGDIDFAVLEGKWRLIYTSAADVLIVLQLQQSTGLIEVGDIFQAFAADGSIQNEIRLSVPFFLAPAREMGPGGVALKVDARFVQQGAKTLALTFQEARVCDVRISDAVRRCRLTSG